MTDNTDRIDPYTLVFGAESMDERLFPPIAEEAEARSVPLDDPERFLFLTSVGKLLQAIAEPEPYEQGDAAGTARTELDTGAATDASPATGIEPPGDAPRPPGGAPQAPGSAPQRPGGPSGPLADEPEQVFGEPGPVAGQPEPHEEEPAGAGKAAEPAGSGELSEQNRAALQHHGRLLFHAFHFWQGRAERVELSEDEVRWLIDEVSRVGGWRLRPPSSVGYLRLPRNLLWTAPAPGLTPEPADGFFWLFSEPEDEPARLHLLLVLGVRPDRPGFSVVPATGVLDDEDHWAEATGRKDGTDFETELPGGELDRLYSVETAAELLKLASRAFWHLDPASG
jgi:hypothetical protein